VGKGIKEMKDKKATRDDDILEDILRRMGEDGLSILTKLIKKLYENGEWHKDSLKLK
jgi:hypothetical protein